MSKTEPQQKTKKRGAGTSVEPKEASHGLEDGCNFSDGGVTAASSSYRQRLTASWVANVQEDKFELALKDFSKRLDSMSSDVLTYTTHSGGNSATKM